jgi:hypothetical protein
LEPLATIWPVSLIAYAALWVPPRSVIGPAVQLNGSFCVNVQMCLPHLKKKHLVQVGHGVGELGRCRRDGDQTGDIPVED